MFRRTALAALAAVVGGLAALPAPAGADILERLAEDPVIRLGYRTDVPPFAYAGDTGLPRGFSVDLCLRIADTIETVLDLERLDRQWVAVDAEDRFDQLANGGIDLLCGASTITFERRLRADFTLPIFVTGAAFLVPADDRIEDLTDLNGTTIGARAGSTTGESLGAALSNAGIEADVTTYEDHDAGLDAVAAGEIDAYMADRAILLGVMRRRGDGETFAVSNTLYSTEIYAIALPRGESRLRLLADRTLSQVYRTDIADIFQRNFGAGAEPSDLLRALWRLNIFPEGPPPAQ